MPYHRPHLCPLPPSPLPLPSLQLSTLQQLLFEVMGADPQGCLVSAELLSGEAVHHERRLHRLLLLEELHCWESQNSPQQQHQQHQQRHHHEHYHQHKQHMQRQQGRPEASAPGAGPCEGEWVVLGRGVGEAGVEW